MMVCDQNGNSFSAETKSFLSMEVEWIHQLFQVDLQRFWECPRKDSLIDLNFVREAPGKIGHHNEIQIKKEVVEEEKAR